MKEDIKGAPFTIKAPSWFNNPCKCKECEKKRKDLIEFLEKNDLSKNP